MIVTECREWAPGSDARGLIPGRSSFSGRAPPGASPPPAPWQPHRSRPAQQPPLLGKNRPKRRSRDTIPTSGSRSSRPLRMVHQKHRAC